MINDISNLNNLTKAKSRKIKFNINIIINDKNNNSHLSATFGQYQINLNEFNKKLNLLALNNIFLSDLTIPLKIRKIVNIKDYSIIVRKISLKTLLENFLFLKYNSVDADYLNSIKVIPIELLYDLIKFHNFMYNLNNLNKSAKLILSYLNTNFFIKNISL